MSDIDQPSEAELRAAYEAEIKQIGVEQIVLEQVVTLINLGMRRTGLQPGTEDERDPAQVRMAIEAVRALLPLVEQAAGPEGERLAPIREALSQMQLAYVRLGGAPVAGDGPSPGAAGEAPPPPRPGTPPPGATGAPPPAGPGAGGEPPDSAVRSGRLWVPGQR